MHRGITTLLATAAILLAGCTADPGPPKITFYAHGEAVEVDAAQFCNAAGTECSPPNPDAIADLRIPADSPVQISVPQEVSSAPWQVVVRYRLPSGEEVGDRSSVFTPGERHSYTLRAPEKGAQVSHVEVQQYSGVLLPSPDGGVQFAIAGTWVVAGHA